MRQKKFVFFTENNFNDKTQWREIVKPLKNKKDFLQDTQFDFILNYSCESKSKLLSREEEYHLFRKMNFFKYLSTIEKTKKDKYLKKAIAVRNFLITCNLGLIRKCTSKLKRDNLEFYSESCFALIRAIEKFDYRRCIKFSTYAFTAIERTRWKYINENSRYHANEKTCKGLVLSFASDNNFLNIEEKDHLNYKKNVVNRLLAFLPNEEQNIIILRFGLNGIQPKTIDEISDIIKKPSHKITSIYEKALYCLQERMRNKLFKNNKEQLLCL